MVKNCYVFSVLNKTVVNYYNDDLSANVKCNFKLRICFIYVTYIYSDTCWPGNLRTALLFRFCDKNIGHYSGH